MAGKQLLSREAIAITVKTVKEGAAAETFTERLKEAIRECRIACTMRQGRHHGFLGERRPEFKK